MPTQEIIGQDEALSLIDLAVKDDLSCLLVGETGCVSGETEVSVNRAGKGYKTTIAHLYNQMNGNPDNLKSVRLGKGHFDKKIPTKIRSYDGTHVRLKEMRNVVYQGEKETLTVTLKNGRTVRATADHQFLTIHGWKRLDALKKGEMVLCDSYEFKPQDARPKKTYLTINNLWFHPYAIRVKTQYNQRGFTKRVETHRIEAEALLNGMDAKTFVTILRTDRHRAKSLKYINPRTHHVHHKDRNHRNNEVTNLEVLTVVEH